MTLTTSNTGLHVRYEKAGLILDALPIPWNADAVIVEANVRLPKSAPRDKRDFTLRWSADGPAHAAELLVEQTRTAPMRVFFRLPAPAQTRTAEVCWRDHSLGTEEVPIISQSAYVESLRVEMPSLHVALGTETAACRSFVKTQAKTVLASAIVQSAGPLAAAVDLGLHVSMERDDGQQLDSITVALTSDQLRSRRALATVVLPKLRWIDTYRVSWHLADRCLHTQTLRTVSTKTLARSLRICAARFILRRLDDTVEMVRSLPERDGRLLLDGIAYVTPCFIVTSGIAGMAGLAPFTLRALKGDILTTLTISTNILISNGPTTLALAAVPANEIERIKHFTLSTGDIVLGNLPLSPAPTTEFTAEGGFAPLDDFLWTPAAEELLKNRLGKLLDDE